MNIGKINFRDCDVRIDRMTDEEIIKYLYDRLYESEKALEKIRNTVTSGFGTKDMTDFNNEILNPLWQVYNKNGEK